MRVIFGLLFFKTVSKLEFSIKLPLFEGPFDLLLFFIERDELDIHDIPIAQITKDFLAYLKALERLNMEVASEFILVAASLMRIKSKMLLPRMPVDEQGQEIDPRSELVEHLLAYQQVKVLAGELEKLEQQQLARYVRGNAQEEILQYWQQSQQDAELQQLNLYKILQAYIKVMQRFEQEQNKPVHKVVALPYSVEQQKKIILAAFEKKSSLSFLEIIAQSEYKIVVIFRFLAILELLQLNILLLDNYNGLNDFYLSKSPEQKISELLL